jgi:hypothetical protein
MLILKIAASETIINLGPMGPILPESESQIRPLTSKVFRNLKTLGSIPHRTELNAGGRVEHRQTVVPLSATLKSKPIQIFQKGVQKKYNIPFYILNLYRKSIPPLSALNLCVLFWTVRLF